MRSSRNKSGVTLLCAVFCLVASAPIARAGERCTPPPGGAKSSHGDRAGVVFVTEVNGSAMQTRSSKIPKFTPQLESSNPVINVSPNERHQTIWGFGGNATDSCMDNIDKLSAEKKNQLIRAFFSHKKDGAGFDYIRVPIGGNDYATTDYTLDDTPGNQPDPELAHFSFAKMKSQLAFLQAVKQVNPKIQTIATAWTAPAWMKDSQKLRGGGLQKKYFDAYARYLLKAIEEYKKNGIDIDLMTVLNEPLIPEAKSWWYFPQMYMSVEDQLDFIGHHLGPMLQEARKTLGIHTQVLLHDHNWANGADTVNALMKDVTIRDVSAGVAFHCYDGDYQDAVKAMMSYPKTPYLNTECSGLLGDPNLSGNFQWWLYEQSVNSLRSGFSGSLGWNLCLDEKGGPKSDGGCVGCRGMVTIHQQQEGKFEFNPEFYALAQTSRVARRGAVRIGSPDLPGTGISNVAFQNPDGSLAVVVRNDKKTPTTVTIRTTDCDGFSYEIPGLGAVSFLWRD